MKTSTAPEKDPIDQIDQILNQQAEDVMHLLGRTTIDIDNKGKIILSWGSPDKRRNADPVEFGDISRKCFCQEESIYYSDASILCLYPKSGKALMCSAGCGPEPCRHHFRDMLKISSSLKENALTIINLPGSGASVPQHFHTQILSTRFRKGNKPVKNFPIKLFENIVTADFNKNAGSVIFLSEVKHPIWGFVLDFSKFSGGAESIADFIYEVIHEGIRYQSQLFISYNIYIESPQWRKITILFRESRMERVCSTQEMFQLVEAAVNTEKALSIAQSDNRFWRWGWLEILGGLPARDNSFDNKAFDMTFWNKVYRRLNIPKVSQKYILGYVGNSISKLKNKHRT